MLRNVNLNLLPVLQVILKTRSVSAAATALGISQPAVSDALAKLRVVLADQLLVRVGSHMTLTGYGERLIDPLDRVCAELEAFLSKDTFDPRTATRDFVVATSDIGAYLLARRILDMVIEVAPGISLQLIDIGPDLTARLAAREIDIVLLPEFALDDLAPAPLRFQAVMAMHRVVLMCRKHPLTQKSVVSDLDITRYRHVAFQPDPVMKPAKRLLAPRSGVQVDFVARTAHALLVPYMLAGTDFVAIVPKELADGLAQSLGLESRPMSTSGPAEAFGFAWSPVQDHDPAHCWFRNTVTQYFPTPGSSPQRSPAAGIARAGLDPNAPETGRRGA